MCGRYSLTLPADELLERFKVKKIQGKLSPVFNAAPSQQLPLITNDKPQRLTLAEWGLIPAWMKDQKSPKRLINARAEGIDTKRTFKSAAEKRRCLVIADGFYEWAKVPGQKYKQPFYIKMKDDAAFAMAGIYEKKDKHLEFAIITVQPNSLLAKIHHRMPAILTPNDEKKWLDPDISLKQAVLMLKSYPATKMKAHPISLKVNSVKNNDPDIINKIPTQKPLI